MEDNAGWPCCFGLDLFTPSGAPYPGAKKDLSEHIEVCRAYRDRFDPEGMEGERRAKKRKMEAQAAALEEHMIKYQAAIKNENKLIAKLLRQTKNVEDLIKRLEPLVETWCREQRQGSDTESD